MMKKFLLCLSLLLICKVTWSAPSLTITTPNTFTANTIIYSSEVNENFSHIKTQYNAHSHTIGSTDITDGTIVNADINASAAIAASKLDTTVVETDTNQTITGDKTFSGTTTQSGDITFSGAVNLPATGVVIGTANQGDIFYDDGTDLARLTPGTDGQFLKTQGASNDPVWAGVGESFVSKTIVSGTSSSSSLTITNTNPHRVIVRAKMAASGGMGIRFESTANSHAEVFHRWDITAGEETTVTNNTDAIRFSVGASDYVYADFSLFLTEDDNTIVYVTGTSTFDSATACTNGNFGGTYDGSGEVNDFQIVSDANFTGEIYLYELAIQ